MNDNIIEARAVTKKYGNVTALNSVDIKIKRGEIYGLVGDNGAGKSTFLKIITGQAFPTSGEISLFGAHLPKDMAHRRKRTGALIESPGYFPNLSVEKTLEYYRIMKGVPGKDTATKILDAVNLAYARKKKCKALSMGMKQRLGLAIALLGEPELLILDEPINGLDPSGIIEIREFLTRLNREKNITIILSSHILSEMEQLATAYGFLKEGRLLEQITAEELTERCSDYVEIQVSDAEKYAVLLEKTLNHSRYQVMPDKAIRITSPLADIETYGKLASDNSLCIYRLDRKQLTLEQYYMNINNGGSIAC